MTWLRRFRPVLYVLGVLLVVGSLLGARLLTHGSGGGSDAPKTAAPPTNGKNGTGPVVIGYVYTKTPMIDYGLPPVLQSGRIAQVVVTEGQEVKKGDVLYEFDTRVQKGNLEKAKIGVAQANVAVEQAKSQLDQYPKKLNVQKQIVAAAKTQAERTQKGYQVYEANLRVTLDREWRDKPEKWKEQYDLDTKLYELDTLRKKAIDERNAAEANLGVAEAAKQDLELQVKKAEEAVRQAQAVVDQAQAVLDQCTVRADADGTVERVSVAAGATLGISTHTPAVVLVPAGPLVVRPEVEAEFAHRIGEDKRGKPVTITDHYDEKITYKGVVVKIGTAFLQKRNAGDGFGMNDTRVLEVVVDVTDPAPPGKPPLKVGQQVRVNFGQ
jgi:multidrug resistance efflux pump